jgi:hypothetical protein
MLLEGGNWEKGTGNDASAVTDALPDSIDALAVADALPDSIDALAVADALPDSIDALAVADALPDSVGLACPIPHSPFPLFGSAA